MADPLISLTRVKSLLGGDAYKWLTSFFVKARFDANDNLVSLVNPRTGEDVVIGKISQPVKLTIPTGFRWTPNGIDFFKQGNNYFCNYDPYKYANPAGTDVYFNPNKADNSGDGLTEATAKRDPLVAAAIAGSSRIFVTGLTADCFALGARGFTGTYGFAADKAFINRTGFEFFSIGSSFAPTFTPLPGYPGVYQVEGITAANCAGFNDLKTGVYVPYIDQWGVAHDGKDKPKRYKVPKKVTSLATLVPGTWWHDATANGGAGGGVGYVYAHDSRNLVGDTYMYPTTSGNQCRVTPTANNVTMYMENFNLIGSNKPMYLYLDNASGITGSRYVDNHCSYQGSTGSNGLNVLGFFETIHYKSADFDAWADTWNIHGFDPVPANNLNYSPNTLMIDCYGIGAGLTGAASASNNSLTPHDYVNLIVVGGYFGPSNDRSFAATNDAHAWLVGSEFEPSVNAKPGNENFSALINSKVWIDGVRVKDGVNPSYVATGTAEIKYRNMTVKPVNSGTGEATGKISSY